MALCPRASARAQCVACTICRARGQRVNCALYASRSPMEVLAWPGAARVTWHCVAYVFPAMAF
eukprot:7970419-Lingulodinium_polyedra.AAC.1